MLSNLERPDIRVADDDPVDQQPEGMLDGIYQVAREAGKDGVAAMLREFPMERQVQSDQVVEIFAVGARGTCDLLSIVNQGRKPLELRLPGSGRTKLRHGGFHHLPGLQELTGRRVEGGDGG